VAQEEHMTTKATEAGSVDSASSLPERADPTLTPAQQRVLELKVGESFLLQAILMAEGDGALLKWRYRSAEQIAARLARWAQSRDVRIAWSTRTRCGSDGSARPEEDDMGITVFEGYTVGKVERGMSLPAGHKKSLSAEQKPLLPMKDGESFVLGVHFGAFLTDNVERLLQWARSKGICAVRRKIDDDVVRIWRVGPCNRQR
jgi:hypothetical protein